MSNRFKIALSLALVLGSASGAFAAHQHPLHSQGRVTHARTESSGRAAYGFVPAHRPSETYIGVQDQFLRESNGE